MDVSLRATPGLVEQLVEAATTGAAPDEVTPPLTPGPDWTAERVTWLREYYAGAADRLGAEPGATAAWAVVVDGRAGGSVRLRRLTTDVVETGIWLVRAARRAGAGRAAIELVLAEARAAGAREVRADTTTDNHAAQYLLRRLGFQLGEPDGRNLPAVLHLADPDADPGPAQGAPEETVK